MKKLILFILLNSLFANNLISSSAFFNIDAHDKKEIKKDFWSMPKLNHPENILRQDENIYGIWELEAAWFHPDDSFTGGEQVEVPNAWFTFYDDGTLVTTFYMEDYDYYGDYNIATFYYTYEITDGILAVFYEDEYYGETTTVAYGEYNISDDQEMMTFYSNEISVEDGEYINMYVEYSFSYFDDIDNDMEDCNDPSACNFTPGSDDDDDCIYAEDMSWCDCDGNISDCSGECGGDDFSCTVMYSDSAGMYENGDCSGDVITEMTGMCLSDDYYGYLFNQAACEYAGGLWIPADTCVSIDIEYGASQEDCEYAGGFYLEYYGGLCYSVGINDEFSNSDECMCGEGGMIGDDYYGYCEEGEFTGNTWFESEPLFDGGPPNLYFYDEGVFAEPCDSECMFMEFPSQEDCEAAGGWYHSWSECEFDETPSQEDCEAAGGYYDYYYYECWIEDEEACGSLDGEWYDEIECDVDDVDTCEDLSGEWYEGVCPIGTWAHSGYDITLAFMDNNGPSEELQGTLTYDDQGNWTSLSIDFMEFDDGMCVQFNWSGDPSLYTKQLDPIPYETSISSVYPNPFNPIANISFQLENYSKISVSITNINGQSVDYLINGEYLSSGTHEVEWNASKYPSGVYFVRLQSGSQIKTQMITLLK